ncbi:MAG: VCBS repeat-containing protein [Kiritimatiellae bacterium]|nr:VCBS repeat-containing protein [Kiritimatiellia bacterium]
MNKARGFVSLWLAAMLPLACLLARAQEDSPPRITRLKTLYPATVLVELAQPRALIAVPDEPAYGPLAETLRDRIARESAARLPVVRAAELVDANWRVAHKTIGARNIIALGNVNNNRLLARLYGERYVVADSVYPGHGGYVIRTVHDPWATGVNVLVLAGSDAAGAAKAIDVFAEKYLPGTGETVVLEKPVVDVVFEKKAYPFFPDETKSAWSKRQPQYRTLEEFRKRYPIELDKPPRTEGSFMGVTGTLVTLGQTYFRTGWEELLPMMKYRVEKYRACLKNPVARKEKDMSARAADHVHWWDLLEELPIWTDAERLDIANALLGDAAQGHERRGFHGAVKRGAVQALDENHGTFSAQHSFDAWHYFHKYYKIPESEYWMKCADAVFSAQASTFQILEDASGYLCYCPKSSMDYAMRSGDLTYLTRGVARQHAQFIAVACLNNLGWSSGFGDSSGLGLWSAYEVLAPAAWFYRDPHLYWVLRNGVPQSTGGRVFSDQMAFDLTVEPREPTEWTGLVRVPCYENPLAEKRTGTEKIFAEKKDVDPTLFNKIVFKENWDANGQYLLLDGAGVWGSAPGPHGHKHDDVNTIINFTDEGRMWLVDHTYEQRAFQDHSGLDLLREGQSGHPNKSLAKILDFKDSTPFGLTRTRIGRWERAIFWKKGDYFLVIDRATAGEDGSYVARCTWKALGEDELRGKNLFLTQKGKFCKIASDGGANAYVEPWTFTARGGWTGPAGYPWAEPVAKYFRQDKVKALKKGESIAFINLLHAYSEQEAEGAVTMVPVSDTCALVNENGALTVMGVGEIPGGAGEAGMFVVTPGAVLTAGCENPPGNGAAARIIAAAKAQAAQRAAAMAGTQAGKHGAKALGVAVRKLGMPVSTLVVADLNGDGTQEWIAGGREGLAAYTAKGERAWLFPTGKDVRAVDVGRLNGDRRPAIVFGADDRKVRALDTGGKLLWEFACKESDQGQCGPPVVDYVKIDDLENDGRPDIVVGANWVHVLNPDGTVKWEQYMAFRRGRIAGDLACCDVADINGDGNKEVVTGWLTSYSVIRAMDHAGKIVMPAEFQAHLHPGVNTRPPLECLAVDLFGTRKSRQIACATKGMLSIFWHDQNHKDERGAQGYVQGPFTTLCTWQPHPDQPAVVIAANDVYGVAAFSPSVKGSERYIRMERLWYQALEEKITRIAAADLTGLGQGEAVVGTEAGNIYVFDVKTGAERGFVANGGAPVTALVKMPGAKPVLAAQADGTVLILSKP